MKLKPGVKLTNIVPQLVVAMLVVEVICHRYGVEFVVTSCNDSKHGDGSLHHCVAGKYTDGMCRAFDVRTKYNNLNTREQEFRDAIKEALGDEFDVVLEAVGTDNEHVHVEYDPKG